MKNYLLPNWSAPSTIQAYSTTRLGGHSLSPFDTFNLGLHVSDQSDHVLANRQQLTEDLQLPHAPVWLNQVHGREVLVLDTAPMEIPSVDAVVTAQKNLVCAILTADCLPILLCNQSGTQVAAIHAGWRGLAAGIIFETIKKMDRDADILAWLGPAIGPTAFEIDEKTKMALSDLLSSQSQNFFKSTESQPGHYLTNLYQIATNHLHACGVKKISGGEYCTYRQSDLFFSYRRSKIQNAHPGVTGRMASLIWLTN